MSRFSGRSPRDLPEPETITVGVKAFLTLSIYVQSAQISKSRTVLVTGSEEVDDATEKFIGVDGETGEPVEITVSYPA